MLTRLGSGLLSKRAIILSSLFGLLLPLFLLWLGFTSSPVLAQNYSQGYQKYTEGDFAAAENAFKLALNKRLSSAEQARLYKMLGISQYMQGKRIAAEDSFQKAKGLNPYINISPSEVTDESVISFFSSVEAPVNNQESSASLDKATAGPVETYLKIYANTPLAEIAVDGVPLGKAGSLIKVSPGSHEVQVTAKGFQSVRQTIDVKEGQVNHVSMNLLTAETSSPPKPQQEELSVAEASVREAAKTPSPPTAAAAAAASSEKEGSKNMVSTNPKATGGRKKIRRVRKRPAPLAAAATSQQTHSGLYLLPLGAGQYMQQSYTLGAAFTASQLAALAWGVSKWLAADKLVVATNEDITSRDERRPTLPAEEQQSDYDETLTFADEQQQKAEALYQQAFIGYGVFGLLWLSSSLEAYMSATTSASLPSKPMSPSPANARARRGRQEDLGLASGKDFYEEWSKQKVESYWRWDISPLANSKPKSPFTLGMALYLQGEF